MTFVPFDFRTNSARYGEGRSVDGSIAGALLVTRAGAFGDENSLLELVSQLRTR